MCMLGMFVEWVIVLQYLVVKVDDWLLLEIVVLVGCGVLFGWGIVVNVGNLWVGDIVVIYGVGGLGINVVQGVIVVGCKYVVVVDLVVFKCEIVFKFGVIYVFVDVVSVVVKVDEFIWGQGVDVVLILVGIVDDEVVLVVIVVIGKGGIVVIIGLVDLVKFIVYVFGIDLMLYEKMIKGLLFGFCNL